MAKKDYMFRYLAIIKKLRSDREATFEEINDFLKNESEFLDRPFSISLRTFQRDIREIMEIFRTEIVYDFSKRVYYIAHDDRTDIYNRMIESADTINTLRIASDVNRYMIFEKRRAQGTHHFRGLLYAIRNRVVIELDHQKFDDENPRTRLTEPYALKESQGRWYLVARDRTDHHIKTFGLDRIIGFRNTPRRFDYPEPGVTDRLFQSCFGVINPSDSEPEEILLEFGPEQGKYIKSYPIHESQVVLSETEKEVRIRLYLHITYDLIMELLSYGDRIGIISPESLRYRLAEIHRNSLKRLP